MNSDIKKFVRTCELCQKKKVIDLRHEPIHPIPVPSYPFERVHADLCGPLPQTENGNKYIFCVVDAFTKWLIAIPLHEQTALTVTNAFIDQFITKYSVPTIVVTDNGRQFISQIFNDLRKIFSFEHRTTTTYRPQTNGMVERQNRTIAQMLSGYVDKNGKNWDIFLQLVIFAFNSSIQDTTKFSPFEALFGRRQQHIIDFWLSGKVEVCTGSS